MDGLASLVLVLAVWLVVTPILGVIAFARISDLERKIAALKTSSGLVEPTAASVKEKSPAAAHQPVTTALAKTKPWATGTPGGPEPEAVGSPLQNTAKQDKPAHTKSERAKQDWEQLIAANWLIWIGGIALTLGGLFLVRVAIDAGFFGPLARTASAAVLGNVLVAASMRANRWKLVTEAKNAIRHLPAILAGAGIIALYGACLAAGALHGLVPPLVALVLFVLVSALSAALAFKHGPMIAALGLAGAYISPILTGAAAGSAIITLPYAASVTAAGLLLSRLKRWRFLSWLTLAGSVFWGLVNLGGVATDLSDWAVPAYALSIGLMGLIFAEPFTRTPLVPPIALNTTAIKSLLRRESESIFAAHLLWISAGAFIFLHLLEQQALQPTWIAMAAYAGASLYAALKREGFGLMPIISAGAIVTALLFWPHSMPGHLATSLGFGAGFGIIGTLLMSRVRTQTPLAACGALAPATGLLLAFWYAGSLEPKLLWGIGALGVAFLLVGVIETRHRQSADLNAHPGAITCYAMGAALMAILAPFLMLSGIWLGPAVAVVALLIAILHQRFTLKVLTWIGPSTAGLAAALLIRPGAISPSEISSVPIFNELTFGFGLAILAIGFASRFWSKGSRTVTAYEAAALTIGFALIGLLIRHTAGGGRLDAPFNGFGEASSYAIAYLGLAATLAWRFPASGKVWRIFELIAAAIGFGGIITALIATGSDEAHGIFIFNLLLPAIAMPALLLAGYSRGLRRAARLNGARATNASAMIIGFLWLSFETRRVFHGPGLDPFGNSSDAEMWAYSFVWIIYALALLFWGVLRKKSSARYASLLVLLLALAKVFLVDLSALEGVIRAVSFIGLGAALIGVALFYQRFVLTAPDPKTETQPD